MLKIYSPAKINLYLDITGRRDNGYHNLNSLIVFTDIHDELIIKHSDNNKFNLSIKGEFASSLQNEEVTDNLISKAINMAANHLNKPSEVTIELTKNIPIGAGLGGGSSNAAAAIRGFYEFNNIDINSSPISYDELCKLGADIPVCMNCKPAYVTGIGENINHIDDLPTLHIVLLYPDKPCSTANIFSSLNSINSKETKENIFNFNNASDFISFLKKQKNDLQDSAINHVPEINTAINYLSKSKGCAIARMSGSGSSCFGIFKKENDAIKAAKDIKISNPKYWVKYTSTN